MSLVIQGYSSSEEELEPTKNTQVVPHTNQIVTQITDSADGTRVGNAIVTKESFDDAMFHLHTQNFKRGIEDRLPNKKRTKRKKGSVEDSSYLGPWAKFKDSSSEDEQEESIPLELEEPQEEVRKEITDDEDEEEEEEEEEVKDVTKFYGSEEFDYQGRTYMHIPLEIKRKETPEECFVPKRQLKKLPGHVRGVTKLEFFPVTNHMLLSCGNDSKIYLWSLTNYQLLRGYFGHDKPVRDINFNNDGTRFLSASYDKTIKLWNTETGEILSQFKLKALPNCIRFNPFNNDEFLVGLTNNKIDHYSISKNDVLQSYDHHLGAINNITFLRDSQRFISTSEDKTIRVWDIGVNIPIKLISDPTLHSIPVVKVHPNDKYFIGQAMDNSIMVFSSKDRFKTNKKKLFTGHNCAGYGIGIDISPDGKYVISGDSSGYLVIWDWKTCKLVKKIEVDKKAILQVAWNQKESSKIAVAGISGSIYYYD